MILFYALGAVVALAITLWVALTVGGYLVTLLSFLVVVGLVILMAWAYQKYPFMKWPVRLGAIGLALTLLFWWAWPAAFRSFDSSKPYISRAMGRLSVDKDIRLSEWIDPLGLGGRVGTIEYCRYKEQVQEGRLRAELDRLKEQLRRGSLSPEDKRREAEALTSLAAITQERRICQDQVWKADERLDPVPPHSESWWKRWFSGIALPPASSASDFLKNLAAHPFFWVAVALVVLLILFRMRRPVAGTPGVGGATGAPRSSFLGSVIRLAILVAIIYFGYQWLTQPSRVSDPAPVPVAKPSWAYVLQAGEERLTDAIAGPGTLHRLKATKPFEMVAGQDCKPAISFKRPAGASTWIGDDPWGQLHLRAIHPDTKIVIEEVYRPRHAVVTPPTCGPASS